MLLSDLATTSETVGATRSRLKKVAALAEALRLADPDEVEIAASYLGGSLRQRRTGLGYASLARLPEPATQPTLVLAEVDELFEHLSTVSGPGSATPRTAEFGALMSLALILI